jgi:hypothetical protein
MREIVEKIPNTILGHSKFLNTLDERNPGEWRYKFASLEMKTGILQFMFSSSTSMSNKVQTLYIGNCFFLNFLP